MGSTSLEFEGAPSSAVEYDQPDQGPSLTDRLQSVRDTMDAATTGVVTGLLPGVGTYLNRGLMYGASLLNPGMSKLGLPAGGNASDNSAEGAYNYISAQQKKNAEEHPVASTVGELSGSLLGNVPMARVFPKIYGGNTFLGQTASSALMGAADAGVRSNFDPTQTAVGLGIGAAGPAMGSILAPVGSAVAAGGRFAAEKIPGVSSVFRRVEPATGAVIKDAADNQFNSLGRMARYDPWDIANLQNDIVSNLYHGSALSPQLGARETASIVGNIHTLPPTPAGLHTARKELEQISGGNDAHAAGEAVKAIDRFLENPPPGSTTYAPGVNGADVIQRLRDANANWRVARNVESADRLARQAQIDANNAISFAPETAYGQAIRKQTKNWLGSKDSQFLTDEQRKAYEDVVAAQSAGERGLRILGGVSGMGRMGQLTGALGLGAGLVYDPMTAAAVAAGGGAASLAQSALSRQAFNRATEALRASAPESQRLMAPQLVGTPAAPYNFRFTQPSTWGAPFATGRTYSPYVSGAAPSPPSLTPYQYRNEIARLLTLQAERSATDNPTYIGVVRPGGYQ